MKLVVWNSHARAHAQWPNSAHTSLGTAKKATGRLYSITCSLDQGIDTTCFYNHWIDRPQQVAGPETEGNDYKDKKKGEIRWRWR